MPVSQVSVSFLPSFLPLFSSPSKYLVVQQFCECALCMCVYVVYKHDSMVCHLWDWGQFECLFFLSIFICHPLIYDFSPSLIFCFCSVFVLLCQFGAVFRICQMRWKRKKKTVTNTRTFAYGWLIVAIGLQLEIIHCELSTTTITSYAGLYLLF